MLLKEKIASGEKIYGTMIRVIRNPAINYIAQNSGLDFLMYDCEHSSFSMQTLNDLFITGNALNFSSFVRVPSLGKEYVSRTLDQGAHGVMVPMLETPEMARRLVDYSKYEPIGQRGFSSSAGHTCYNPNVEHIEFMNHSNDVVMTIAQIETKLSVENANEIAATPGIDALLVGPHDLSVSLGISGDLFNDIEIEAISKVIRACKENGKAFGLHASLKLHQMFIQDEDIVMMKGDTDVLSSGFRSIKETLTNLTK